MDKEKIEQILVEYGVSFTDALADRLLEEFKPCDDAISREAVKEQMIKYGFHAPDMTVTEFVEDLPPVKTQKNIVNYGTMNITL